MILENYPHSCSLIRREMLKRLVELKDEKKFKNYELLFDEALSNTDEPYYGNSKATATQTISRILKGFKITDEMARLISNNLNVDYQFFVFGLGDLDYSIFKDTILIEIFKESFLIDEFRSRIIECLKDYIPFGKYIINNDIHYKYVSNNQTLQEKLKELIYSEEFDIVLKNAIFRLLRKIEHNEIEFNAICFNYFSSSENHLKNLSRTIFAFFDYCLTNYFEPAFAEYRSDLGLAAYDLLDNIKMYSIVEYEMHNDGKDLNLINDSEEYFWKLKRDLWWETQGYVGAASKYQEDLEQY